MTAKQIRAGLRVQKGRKKRAQDEIIQADAAITDLLREVPKVHGITMEEAAEEVGVSRNMAYKMIRKASSFPSPK
ncbi:MAG TPA: hypothetical protein VHZ54_14380 [Solirubrobacterales bacterium]|nr:hypothetical protein [Solirubrobacterales bacterium]